MEFNIDRMNELLKDDGIVVSKNIHNSKASESYVHTMFVQDDGFSWETYVPYCYRRSGLSLTKEEDIVEYLKGLKPFFTKAAMEEWRDNEIKKWQPSKATVTKGFFMKLLSFKEETEFPQSDNPARRIQDIKDSGYTVASIPIGSNKKTKRILLPIPLNKELEYETFTPQFKKRVIRLLKNVNAFEARCVSSKVLIPDHKFSEIRWDEETKKDNTMQMTDEEILQKFQLLDN